ncbi:hypothetical protein TWF694_003923 [Orbilia ellipsospora]|uniref:Uncharacterized protein n=1 Tax=Orbilia ellipsospora TaxID=2528407 RepID=A0AAV9WWI1_9PEZI
MLPKIIDLSPNAGGAMMLKMRGMERVKEKEEEEEEEEGNSEAETRLRESEMVRWACNAMRQRAGEPGKERTSESLFPQSLSFPRNQKKTIGRIREEAKSSSAGMASLRSTNDGNFRKHRMKQACQPN